jgi:cyd operon protein YbgT
VIALALAYLGAAAALLVRTRRSLAAFLASGLAVAGIVATAGLSLFPFLLPSSTDPRSSLTVWDASSSRAALFIMLVATVIFLPIIIAYTGWVFRVMRGPVTAGEIARDRDTLYRLKEKERRRMWYFSWVLGLGLACSFAILNAMWFELASDAPPPARRSDLS